MARGGMLTSFAVGALAVLTVPPIVVAQRPEDAAQLVVMIKGMVGAAPTSGAGVIIGLANDRLYIATANHVVRRGDSEVKDLQVQLKWLPGEWMPARLLEHSDTALDVGVIAVPDAGKLGSPGFEWRALTRPDNLMRGTKVFPIGYPGGIGWLIAVQPHVVSAVTTSLIRAEGNLVNGHSGGALVTEDGGIVGLVSNVDAVLGESQRIDRVMDKLAEWGYHASLTWKPASRVPDPPKASSAPDASPVAYPSPVIQPPASSLIQPPRPMGPLMQGQGFMGGTDIRDEIVASAAECSTLCARENVCVAMTYIISQRKCYLKHAQTTLGATPDMISAVKK